MNRESVRQQLRLAERHIRDGEYRIARLHELASLLTFSGVGATGVMARLEQEERQQDMRKMDRGRLIAMLAWYEQCRWSAPRPPSD
ncbi:MULTISPECIES: hypothetical protein [unclassified Chelatococcus]|uniref:hypothetical protein n=1 Tax=unclassified Chelatococcus TaxID=2638111 RepID=UPI001BCD4915|nr:MULTISPECIES: hypothetical protein [unclassified Chelatococcus]MBS7700428.1 hypothetical protein [Chelatococcus sp. YT9]MBX3556224.1 hypothetical protein [Chelatococcus sp.]